MSQSETVIEISIEETNKLRQSLGLAPLRVNSSSKPSHDSNSRNTSNNHTTSSIIPSSTLLTTGDDGKGATATDEVLSLSVSETNDLRKSLGLPPLRENKNIMTSNEEDVIGQRDDNIGRKSSLAIHKPAPNTHQESILQERIERSKLEREVQEGIRKFEKKTGIVDLDQEQDGKNDKRESMDNLSWADLMRKKATGLDLEKKTIASAPIHGKKKSHGGNNANKYKDDDMQEQNLIVSHNVSDFQEGTTAILTLKDQAILDTEGGSDGDDEAQVNLLENVDMAEQQVLKHNLKQKRLAQLGMGHAGGYTGYDDDEFMELGGNVKSHPSITSHKGVTGIGTDEHDRKVQGFQILGNQTQVETSKGHGGKHNSDLFASLEGKEISLESALTGSSRQQDFMTAEEEEEEEQGFGNHSSAVSKEKLERKRKRREKKARKKLKKYQKDGAGDMDDDNSQTIQPDSSKVTSASLLEELEASSKNRNSKKRARRMRRTNVESDESEGEEQLDKSKSNGAHLPNDASQVKKVDSHEVTALNQKREKYFSAVEKGNQRSRALFDGEHDTLDKPKSHPPAAAEESVETMAMEDDAFLTAAISKARRLKRLRELHAKNALSSNVPLTDQNQAKGAKAVVEALQKWKKEGGENNGVHINTNSTGNVTFELGTTKEFTQALRAQSMIIAAEEDQHDDHRRNHVDTDQTLKSSSDQVVVPTDDDALMEDVKEQKPLHSHDTTATLEELAQQVQEDNILPNGDVFDSTGTTTGVGRGLSTFLGMLKKTGEIANKGKLAEELRGRAKDEKTYEDYAPLDLQNVVKIDDGIASKGGPFDKDIELANREVKLEYRDEHGRLLTRKEAYRQLCYQFHGHGSSKKKQEKRLQQIERERAELSSQNATDAGTLGALKATQKATGKAFVLHKT